MIRGTVTPEQQAVIRLGVLDGAGERAEIEAVLDTGFTDFLTLSPSLVAALDLPYAAKLLATVAGGAVMELDTYRATVLWDDAPRDILVAACEGSPLIGMSLLHGHDLFIEAVVGGAVTITKRRSLASDGPTTT